MQMTYEQQREELKNYDFFKKEPMGLMNTSKRTVKVHGDFKTHIPLVTILVTTCNRPDMLRETLTSIMNQQDFDDFEIIVLDNECAPIEQLTETNRLIVELNNDKIIYFRNLDEMPSRTDKAVSLARTEWVCVCHDDDMLASNHMKIMTDIVSLHPEIDFLACELKSFTSKDINAIKSANYIACRKGVAKYRKADVREGIFCRAGGWLGGFIRKSKYVEMGGMPSKKLGMGDMVMVSKFCYYYSYYLIRLPLYYYRRSEVQASADKSNQIRVCLADYFFYRYAFEKIIGRHKILEDILCSYCILSYVKRLNSLGWNFKIDPREVSDMIGIKYVDIDNSVRGYLYSFIWKKWVMYLNRYKTEDMIYYIPE